MRLEGEKIYLKPFTAEHAENFVKWSHDAEVCRFLTVTPKTLEEELNFIEDMNKEPNPDVILAIHLKKNNKHIGNCGIHKSKIKELPDVQTVGLMIGEKDEWGKGYGIDVMKTLLKHAKSKGYKEVYLDVHAQNTPAINVYNKCGFKIVEGDFTSPEINTPGKEYVMKAEL